MYQGSHRSGVTVTLYPALGDGEYGAPIKMSGTSAKSHLPCILGVSVQASLGQAASFSVTLRRAEFENPLDAMPLDSWVDISFTDGGLSWHVLRGLVDEVRVSTQVSEGVTSVAYVLVGRSFQKAWEDMTANFNPFLGDRESDAEALQAVGDFVGAPDQVVRAILLTIMRKQGQRGKGLWAMPKSMPGVTRTGASRHALFVDAVRVLTQGFDQYGLPRRILSQNLLQGGGAIWGLAQSLSDSTLCELYSELWPRALTGNGLGALDTDGTQGLAEGQSMMAAWLRDKPFMVVDPAIGAGPIGTRSPYFILPQFELPLQVCTALDVGRQGYERLNAFWIGNPDGASSAGNFIVSKQPLWDTRDQTAHGLREYIIPQTYTFFGAGSPPAAGRTIDSCMDAQRRLVRDFYCANATFLSGQLQLANGAPWLKLGCRLAVRDQRDVEPVFNGYIEGYSHAYSPQGGTRTSVTFTRGFYGEERDMLDMLRRLSGRYTMPDIRLGLPAAP